MARTGDRPYRRKQQQLKRTQDTCHLCGGHINPDLKWPHPQSFSADHLDAVANGGHNLGPLAAAHLKCNQSRGKKPLQQPTTHLWDI